MQPRPKVNLRRTPLFIIMSLISMIFFTGNRRAVWYEISPHQERSRTLLERWPHVYRVKITFTLLPMNRFVSTTTNSMNCLTVCLREDRGGVVT